MNMTEQYREIYEKILEWKSIATMGYLKEHIGISESITSEIMYPADIVQVLVILGGLDETIRSAFIMGMLWQRYLDSDAGNALNDLLKDVDVNLD